MRLLFSVILWMGMLMEGVCVTPKTYKGLVYDNDTHRRLARVFVRNARTNIGIFNNYRGEFSIQAATNDVLIAELPGFKPDTLVLTDSTRVLIFRLTSTSKMLSEVTINASKSSPQQWHKEKRRENAIRIDRIENSDILSVNPGMGAGIGIDALYNMFSSEGKDVRYLQGIIQYEYQQKVIDGRFNTALVSRITALKGEQLKDFMEQYRPSYTMVVQANDYDLASYIKWSCMEYRVNPNARRIVRLKTN